MIAGFEHPDKEPAGLVSVPNGLYVVIVIRVVLFGGFGAGIAAL